MVFNTVFRVSAILQVIEKMERETGFEPASSLGTCMSNGNKRHSVFNTLFLAIESIEFSIWFSAVIYLET
jgi:hypothetical protein